MNINQDILKKVLKKNNFSEADLLVIYDGKIQASDNHTPPEIQSWIALHSALINSALPIDSQILAGGGISAEAMTGISVDPHSDGNELAHNNTVSFDGNTAIHIPNSKSLKNWTTFFDLNINFSNDKGKAVILLTNKEYIDDENPGLWMIFINAAGFLCYEYINANGEKIGHTSQSRLPEKCLIAASKNLDGLITFYIYDPVAEKMSGKESFVINEPTLGKDWAIGGSKKHFETLPSLDPVVVTTTTVAPTTTTVAPTTTTVAPTTTTVVPTTTTAALTTPPPTHTRMLSCEASLYYECGDTAGLNPGLGDVVLIEGTTLSGNVGELICATVDELEVSGGIFTHDILSLPASCTDCGLSLATTTTTQFP